MFEKGEGKECVDILSYDPGLVNAGVVHLRVDRRQKKFCVLHTVLLSLKDPVDCFLLEKDRHGRGEVDSEEREEEEETKKKSRSKKKKAERVEPYSYLWPELDFGVRRGCGEEREGADSVELRFEDTIALLPRALLTVDWLTDKELDYVLIEVQDPRNPQMRALGHSIQTFYTTLNLLEQKETKVQFVSSRLKLSPAVLIALGGCLSFGFQKSSEEEESDGEDGREEGEEGGEMGEEMRLVVDTHSHAAKKSSAIQVFKVLGKYANSREKKGRQKEKGQTEGQKHRFFEWVDSQRATKHNILDSLLQALSFCLQEGIGFDASLLKTARKRKSTTAAAKKKQKVIDLVSDEEEEGEEE